MLEAVSLREAFDAALERVFSEVPFEERLEATRRALLHWGLSEETIQKGALPGAIYGQAVADLHFNSPVLFTRPQGLPVLESLRGRFWGG